MDDLPRPVVGIVGAGQLARMSLGPATALDIDLRVLAASADDAAALVWPRVDVGAHDDVEAVLAFASSVDVVTFDHELVPPSLVTRVAADTTVRPGPDALLHAQDKVAARQRVAEMGVDVPRFAAGDLHTVGASDLGWPRVLKAPRGGYDGRGVAVARSADELHDAWHAVGAPDVVLAEEHIDIDAEIAVLLARRPGGEIVMWPVVRTVQSDGVLVVCHVPAEVDAGVEGAAQGVAAGLADALDVVGVMAVELFVRGSQVLVNEIALRPHNSGHWTIEGSRTSQFAQHLRAVLDLPLGACDATAAAVATANVLGADPPREPAHGLAAALAVPGASVHLYGKQPRPGRKLGHVSAVGADVAAAVRAARTAAAHLAGVTAADVDAA